MTIEDELMDDVRNGRQVDIERALLIASGCDTEEKVSEYKAKISELERQFYTYACARNVYGEAEAAKALHEFLWNEKPRTSLNKALTVMGFGDRYIKGHPLLTKAIDRQMSPKERHVSNCKGLTLLYTVLGLRSGLNVSVLNNPVHILSRVRAEGREINIEHTSREGFGIDIEQPEKVGYMALKEGPVIGLIGDLYLSRGNMAAKARCMEEAAVNFRKAVSLLPDDPSACANYGGILAVIGRPKEALPYLSRAIGLLPIHAKAYYTRGRVKECLGDIIGAEQDLAMYKQLAGDSL
ncbi:MAG TPA: hypothetical protein HA362_07725 [Nanoarchaeota archaeon]|nr:hypothetical protein [Nanoarchaeota archaeon]